MRKNIKRIFYLAPVAIQRLVLSVYENHHARKTAKRLHVSERLLTSIIGRKPRILFYHVSGLSFGGTEKFLQIISKYISKEKYDISYMYSPKPRSTTNNIPLNGRLNYLTDSDIELIEFSYETLENKYPYAVVGMKPSIFDILEKKQIDLLITAGPGYSEFPFNILEKTPVININIFGSPNAQQNIVANVCISNEVAQKITPLVPQEKIEIMYIQSEKPKDESKVDGAELRKRLGINETDIVFGRIGRADDGIFDPIGINAFEKVVKQFPTAHYLIMSPPPILQKIVEDRKIPNVHLLPPSANEKDIWAFHQAIDVAAHFRFDGESCGLNIIESMLCGKPVITHRSDIWNAHTEYLEPAFSRISRKDNVEEYHSYMVEMVKIKEEGNLATLGEASKKKAEGLFLMENNIKTFESWVDKAIQ